MDPLDRTYQHLVKTIRARFPQYVSQSFDVAELYQTILPYRHHRRDLALDTNEDYEIALTELLSGARDYLIVDERMRDALRSELASPNPDPSAFKEFADASVALSPAALRRLDGLAGARSSVTAPSVEPQRASTAMPAAAAVAPIARRPAPPPPAAVPTPPASPPIGVPVGLPSSSTTPRAGEQCRACAGVLPAGRAITFCPHCGQNLTTTNCLACGSELELTWKYCPVCGRPATGAR